MARKRQGGLAEDLLAFASRAPWWAGLLMAAIALVVLQGVAGIEVRPSARPGELASLVLLQTAKAIASILKWIVPPLFLVAAGLSYFRQRKEQASVVRAAAASAPVKRGQAPELDRDWDIEIRHAYDQRIEPKPLTRAKPTAWSRDVLARMDWKRFEALTAAYYEHLGFRAETLACGPDGGVDVKVFRGDEPQPAAIVQCKAWTSRPIGVKPVRELLGVMVHNRVDTGVFLTTSKFTEDAIEFAGSHRIALGTGDQLLAKFEALPDVVRQRLLDVAVEGDWTTPTCPSCGTKMVERQGTGAPFWGCVSFPRCRRTFTMKPE